MGIHRGRAGGEKVSGVAGQAARGGDSGVLFTVRCGLFEELKGQLRYSIDRVPVSFGEARVGVLLDVFVSPLIPPGALEAGKQLKKGPRRTGLDEVADLVGLSGMLALLGGEEIHLGPTRLESTHASSHTEEEQLRDISEVETHSTPVGSSILADLVPN
jgi:hypothetical protein